MRAGGLGFPGLFPRDPRPSQAMISNWGGLTGCVLRVATPVRRETSQLLIYIPGLPIHRFPSTRRPPQARVYNLGVIVCLLVTSTFLPSSIPLPA